MNGGAQFFFRQFIDSVGNPYSGVKVYHTAAGTDTLKNVWTDEGKVTPAANPVVGDSRGMVSFYADGDYKLVIKDSADVTLYTWDNVKITSDTATLWEGNAGTAYPTAATANRWQQFLKHDASNNMLALGVNTGSAFKDITHGIYAHMFSSFTDAVTAAAGKTLIIMESINLPAGAITIPSNVSVFPIQGGVINKSAATSLTINGPVVGNPRHQWLSGFVPGDVIIDGVKNIDIWSEWWGAVADSNGATGNGTDNGTAINCAIRAILGATQKPSLGFTGGGYRFTTPLNFTPTGQVTGFTVRGNAPRGSLSGSQAPTCMRLIWDGVDSARAITSTVLMGDRINGWLAMGFDIEGISITKATGNTSTVTMLELNIGSCTFKNVTAYGGQRGIDFNGIDNVMIGVTGTENGIGLSFSTDYGFTTTKNYFYGCAFSYNSQQGILDTCSAGTEIYGCDLEFNGREAIRIDLSANTPPEGNSFTILGGHIEGNSINSASFPQQVFVKGHASASYDNFQMENTTMQMSGDTATRHVYIERVGNAKIAPKWLSLAAPTTAHIYDGGNNNGVIIEGSITTTDGAGNVLPTQYPQGYVGHATNKPAFVFKDCGVIIDSVDHGLVIPRMTTAQRLALAGLVGGTCVHDTTLEMFYTYRNSTWFSNMAAAQIDSVATDVATLKTDFNNLLAKLRTAGLLST